ncbi:MAG TPA: VOC family protein [Pyrinomonadaceae bacterium]|nr:VOC family protein [Pyrinomonadaceae bacterium]
MSMNVPEPVLDHLVYATSDLEATCRDLEVRLGVRASAGGQHPGRGTHNALISIGPKAYLEIIGPDPLQPEIRPVWFGIDQLTAPKLITWAVRIDNLEAFVKEISPNANVGVMRPGSRKTPEGTTLSWQLTEPQLVQGIGLVPFLIEWNSRQHPADSAITGPRLVHLRLEHPEPELIRKQLNSLRVEVAIEQQPNPALVAIFEGANDLIELK